MLELEEEAEKLREVQTLAERQLMYNPLAGKIWWVGESVCFYCGAIPGQAPSMANLVYLFFFFSGGRLLLHS